MQATATLCEPIGPAPHQSPPSFAAPARARVLQIPDSIQGEPRPFPIEPVIEICSRERVNGVRYLRHGRLAEEGRVLATALTLGLNRNRIYRWLKCGLSADQADAIAVYLGRHPCAIWPQWFALAPSDPVPDAPWEPYGTSGRHHIRQAVSA